MEGRKWEMYSRRAYPLFCSARATHGKTLHRVRLRQSGGEENIVSDWDIGDEYQWLLNNPSWRFRVSKET